MEKILDDTAREAVKAEKEEKRALPWFTNPPIGYDNYSYAQPFPSPLPSPLDQAQSSLFNTFEGEQSFPAPSSLWYSQMLENQDMKSFYLMRQGLMGHAKSPLANSSPQSTLAGSMNTSSGVSIASLNAVSGSNSGIVNGGMAGHGSGLQSPPVTPYLNENTSNLGNLHQQQLRAMMQLRAMGYGNTRPKMNLIPERRDEMIGSPAGDSQARNVMTVKTLEKEKPFQCSYPGCEARFPRMYNLKSHMLCHTGERPHVCPLECGAKFARKHDLQRHMRTLHSPNRPFQCPYEKCQQAFRRANSFWRHLVEDHPEKSAEHAEIYQRAVQQQKVNQEGKNLIKPSSAAPAPIEIPLSAPALHAVEGQHSDPFFSSIPRFNDSMIYRGHFN